MMKKLLVGEYQKLTMTKDNLCNNKYHFAMHKSPAQDQANADNISHKLPQAQRHFPQKLPAHASYEPEGIVTFRPPPTGRLF